MLNRGIFRISDERIGFSFFAYTRKWMEIFLLKRGYHKGAPDGFWIMPGEIIIDEEYPAI